MVCWPGISQKFIGMYIVPQLSMVALPVSGASEEELDDDELEDELVNELEVVVGPELLPLEEKDDEV